jgi:hypothetical protein
MAATAVMNPVDIGPRTGHLNNGTLYTAGKNYQVNMDLTADPFQKAKMYPSVAICKAAVGNEIKMRHQSTRVDAKGNKVVTLDRKQITHLDVMTIMLKIMILLFDNRVMEKLMRKAERDEQVKYLMQTVENYMSQGSSLKNSAIAGAVMSFAAAFLPMFGYTSWGEKLKGWITPLNKMSSQDAYRQWGKMADMGRKVSDNVGQIQTTYREADRAESQQRTDIARTDGEESSRVMQHTDEDIRNVLNFFLRLLEGIMQEVRAGFQ